MVDDQQPQVVKLQVLLQKLVGADQQVHLSRLGPGQNVPHLGGGPEPGEHLDVHREGPEPVHRRGIVLLGQDGGGHQNGGLRAVQNALHHRPQGHLGLAVAHVAAQQPVHGPGLLHIGLDVPDGLELVVGLRVGEGVLKLLLPGAVRREGMACQPLALGIQPDQALGQVLGGGLGLAGGLGPLGAPQLIELGALVVLAGADVLADQVQRRGRNVQHVLPGVGDLDIVLLHPVHRQAQHGHEPADAVVGMDHQVSGGQVRVGLELLLIAVPPGPGLFGPAGQGRGQLPLRQHRQPPLRIFAPGGESAHGNEHRALFRGLLPGQVHGGGDLPVRQHLAKVPGPDLAAAQHHHPIAGGEIVGQVRAGQLQGPAVAGQLLGRQL